MIPKEMEIFLREHLSGEVIQRRTLRNGDMCFLEFGRNDELILSRLGISIDKLGPILVACLWNETSEIEIGGYLVVDNLSMGSPAMGGIRMLPDITPQDIHNLARGMTLKNGAANLPYGGGKSGIVAKRKLSIGEHTEIVRGFAQLLRKYRDVYVPGPDVGTNDNDMKTIAIENGLDNAVSKPADLGGNRIDELGGAAGGVIIALETLLEILPRLRVLPQFSNLEIPAQNDLTVMFQGFGAVGAHAARIMSERLPEGKTIGVSDLDAYLYDENGLPVDTLFMMWKEKGIVTNDFFRTSIKQAGHECTTKYSTDANDLLRESAFCFVPCAPVFNYLSVLPSEKGSMDVRRMGDWSLIIEGANTYSPDLNRKAARIKMEQMVYRQKGVMIANDYLVNSGGVIFAAQEHMVPTPENLQIPLSMLGNQDAIEKWLGDHADEFEELSEKRLESGEAFREKVIRHNMIELVEILSSDVDMLPCAAAEQVSLRRLNKKEHERKAQDIMIPIQTIHIDSRIQEAASLIVKGKGSMVAVLDSESKLVGVVTTWDITKAISEGVVDSAGLAGVLTTEAITASPTDSIVEVARTLEQNQISAMPVVEDGKVRGLVNSDLLAHRFLMQIQQNLNLQ
jgi:glutamate dehydrogenase (NAD(P)+)